MTALANQGLSLKDYRKTAKGIKKKIMDICESQANHPGIQHIQNIFRAHPKRLFQWVKSPEVPADNNFAERSLRPTVIARKISFGSHSEKGLETREILMTIMHTAKCRGRDPAEFLEEVLDIFAKDKSADISHMLIPETPIKKSRAA